MKRSSFLFSTLVLFLGGIGAFFLSLPVEKEALAGDSVSLFISTPSTNTDDLGISDPSPVAFDEFPVSFGEEVTVKISQSQFADVNSKGKLSHTMPSFFTNIKIDSSSSLKFYSTASQARKNNGCVLLMKSKPSLTCYSFPKNAIITYTAKIDSNTYSRKSSAMITKVQYQYSIGDESPLSTNNVMDNRKFVLGNRDASGVFTVIPNK